MSTMTGRMECRYCQTSSFHLPGCPCQIRPRSETTVTSPANSETPAEDLGKLREQLAEQIEKDLDKDQRLRLLFSLASRYPKVLQGEIDWMKKEGLL